jgi:phage shock protein C
MDPNRRIARSSSDRLIAGVCGGLGQYLGIDSTLVRIGFVLLTLAGVSPLLYIVLWVVLPLDTALSSSWTQQVQQSIGEMQERATTIAREVSTQVQQFTNSDAQTPPPNPTTPSSSNTSDSGPNTGPTRRL